MYKDAKIEFRRSRREAEGQFHLRQIEQLCRQSEIDQKGFWYLVNKVKKTKKSLVKPVESKDGQMLTDPKEVAEDWTLFYEELFTKVGRDKGYDDTFSDHVEQSLNVMEVESHGRPPDVTRFKISEKEVKDVLDALKNKKAPGFDRVTNEHLKYAVCHAIKALTTMFNSIIELEHVPKCLKKGIIVPIPKGGGKDTTQQTNYLTSMHV